MNQFRYSPGLKAEPLIVTYSADFPDISQFLCAFPVWDTDPGRVRVRSKLLRSNYAVAGLRQIPPAWQGLPKTSAISLCGVISEGLASVSETRVRKLAKEAKGNEE